MTKSIRVNEYYDLFDVKTISSTTSGALTNLPTNIIPNNEYNSFRGFNNFSTSDASSSIQPYNANNSQYQEIAGKHKSPQATSSIRIDENGDIWCYPPNVSVPYWSRIIFRNFDYNIKSDIDTNNKYYTLLSSIASNTIFKYEYPMIDCDTGSTLVDTAPLPFEYWGKDLTSDPTVQPPFKRDFTKVKGLISKNNLFDYNKCPLFLRFDEYQSRSKIIFSGVDKTRNPDIEYNFNYHKGQIEPIKLNLSFSANIPTHLVDSNNTYNQNLKEEDIVALIQSCYWCIEWICDKDVGN